MRIFAATSLFSILTMGLAGCSGEKRSSGVSIPSVLEVVEESAPAGLIASTLLLRVGTSSTASPALTGTDIKEAFFEAGPTNLLGILESVDGRMAEIETRSAETDRSCLSATPVSVPFSIAGESFVFWGQCYDVIGTGVIIFGKKDDVWYIYDGVGAAHTVAALTPSSDGLSYTIKAYSGVGLTNTPSFDSMSYGLISLEGDTATESFEMSTTGMGFGFCGMHMRSSGAYGYAKGYQDSTAGDCHDVEEICVNTSTLTSQTLSNCTTAGLDTFVRSSLARQSVSGSSVTTWAAVPTGTAVTLNGSTTDSLQSWRYTPTTAAAVSGLEAF